MLCHVPDRVAALAESHRVLAPEGLHPGRHQRPRPPERPARLGAAGAWGGSRRLLDRSSI
ncbi:MAG: hypothetical protein ACYDEA_09030 [Candidatus Dormibacteria bacterium]